MSYILDQTVAHLPLYLIPVRGVCDVVAFETESRSAGNPAAAVASVNRSCSNSVFPLRNCRFSGILSSSCYLGLFCTQSHIVMLSAILKEARPSIIARFRPLSSHEDSQECVSVTDDSVQLSTNSSTHKFSYDQVLVRVHRDWERSIASCLVTFHA